MEYHYTKKDFDTKANEEVDNFFIGFFRTISRSPEEKETVSFSAGSPLSRGATQAKIMFLRTLRENYSKIANYLPDECFYSTGRLDHIYFFLTEMIVEKDIKTLKLLKDNILKLLMRFIRVTGIAEKWKFLTSYKVPSSKVLEGLYRYKEKVVKGKKKSVPTKPKRPSKRIEVIYPEEKAFIEMYEGSFADFNSLTKKLKDGIPLDLCDKYHFDCSKLTRERWETVKRFSAALSYRRKILVKIAKELKLKTGLTKATIKIVVQAILDREVEISHNEFIDLSSYNIITSGKGMTRLSNGYKNVILNKSLYSSLVKIHEDDNSDTYMELLNSNLELIYKDGDRPNLKRHLEKLKSREDDVKTDDLEKDESPDPEVNE